MRVIFSVSAAACLAASLAAEACADSPVSIDGADSDARAAIKRLLPDRDAPTSLFDAERLADEAAARAQAWLRAEGYYEGEARAEAEDSPPRAHVTVTLGPRFHLNPQRTFYEGTPPEAQPQAEVTSALKLAPAGAPARAEAVLAAEAAAVSVLQRQGYPDATADARRVVVDHADDSMSPEYHFSAGDRARLGVLRVDPADIFRPGFLERVQNWREGARYDPDAVAQVRRDISSTGAVTRVSTELVPRPGDPSVRDVVVHAEAAKRRAVEYGIGYSTTDGANAQAEWTWRNITHRGDTLALTATLGERTQGLSADLARPHAAGLGRTIRYTTSVEREDTDAYEREGVAIGAVIEAAPHLRQALTYGVKLSADSYQGGGVDNALVLSTFADLRRDTTDNRFDAHEGDIFDIRLEPAYSAGDASIAFVRGTVEARTYETPKAGPLTLAARAQLGWVAALYGSDEDIPPDHRFYAGGGGSVRGYAYNSIYPQSRMVEGATPGGQGLAQISAEARYKLGRNVFDGNLGVVGFVDGGSAFDTLDEAGDVRWGAGLGVRYDLGFAPLRIDLATPLNRGPNDPSFALYVSLGQAF